MRNSILGEFTVRSFAEIGSRCAVRACERARSQFAVCRLNTVAADLLLDSVQSHPSSNNNKNTACSL